MLTFENTMSKIQTKLTHPKSKPPAFLLPWLHYIDFLTQKLKSEVGDAQLQVIGQRWDSPNWWNKYTLNLDHEQVMHREILMRSFDECCWYARTILPHTTYEVNTVLFDRLNQESLGQLIFNGSAIKRSELIIYPINEQSLEYYWLNDTMHQQETELWVRRSTFMLQDVWPFYLVEIFLPGLKRVLS